MEPYEYDKRIRRGSDEGSVVSYDASALYVLWDKGLEAIPYEDFDRLVGFGELVVVHLIPDLVFGPAG